VKAVRLLTFIILTTLLAFNIPGERVSLAQHYCGTPTICTSGGATNNCIPVPTSLPAINLTEAGDWYIDAPNSHCGASRCYYLFACECGAPISSRLCTGSEKGSA
jgi:hypothetical protein